jgi:hypothetical protein
MTLVERESTNLLPRIFGFDMQPQQLMLIFQELHDFHLYHYK